MIEVSLRRAQTPEDLGEWGCDLCARPFTVESVSIAAKGLAGEWGDLGTLCPACLSYLGGRNPARFPTLEEYEEAKQRYPDPIWPSVDELNRAEDERAYEEAYRSSWISRV